uniref:Ig-like domain-containing protein n=1 Tax=Takifugu rubripes TaxID=31033 RepID=A0A674P128_TAKRU
MEPWLWILLAALCFGRYQTTTRCHCLTLEARTVCVRCGNSLNTVTLDCTFQTTDPSPYLFWYKQDGTSRPQFILSRVKGDKGKTEDEFKERFSSTVNSTMKSAPLKIQELQLSDSAVYYCALRPTVTGSSKSAH